MSKRISKPRGNKGYLSGVPEDNKEQDESSSEQSTLDKSTTEQKQLSPKSSSSLPDSVIPSGQTAKLDDSGTLPGDEKETKNSATSTSPKLPPAQLKTPVKKIGRNPPHGQNSGDKATATADVIEVDKTVVMQVADKYFTQISDTLTSRMNSFDEEQDMARIDQDFRLEGLEKAMIKIAEKLDTEVSLNNDPVKHPKMYDRLMAAKEGMDWEDYVEMKYGKAHVKPHSSTMSPAPKPLSARAQPFQSNYQTHGVIPNVQQFGPQSLPNPAVVNRKPSIGRSNGW